MTTNNLPALDRDSENAKRGEGTVVIDPNIWKKSGLSRPEFLGRIRALKKIRVRELVCSQEATVLPVFSYFPRNLESWGLLEQFHNLVNNADFSVFEDRTTDFIIAIVLAPQLARWLLNTEI